jgi:hypothetical protein
VDKKRVLKAAEQFASGPNLIIEPLGSGLIHQTFKVTESISPDAFVLQAINTDVFSEPGNLVYNYQLVYESLLKAHAVQSIPPPIYTKQGNLMWTDEDHVPWRATGFIEHSFSLDNAETARDAFDVAAAFGSFTRALAGLDTQNLKPVIPRFHDLSFRLMQLQVALDKGDKDRRERSRVEIEAVFARNYIIQFYESMQGNPAYPSRVMHHDCKISNILFDTRTHRVICPVDLDTVMPGKFFSDLGDMVRSMACTVDENCIRVKDINIRPEFYKAILDGYLEGIGSILTPAEQENLHFAGLIMIFMQAVRFLTDFLGGDTYYRIQYPEQNLNRALNQLTLLQKLEDLLEQELRNRKVT